MPKGDLTAVQQEFLENYLDAEFPEPDETTALFDAVDFAELDLADIWLLGRTAADSAISALQAELEKDDDPNLQRIAQFGMQDLTDGHQVKVTKAMLGYNSAAPGDRPGQIAPLLAALADLETHLEKSELVTLLEDNAWDIPVAIRTPLNRAIAQMRAKMTA